MLEETLASYGYDTVACADGAQAWEALRQKNPPELAILDWMMPAIDGPDVCRKVRQSTSPSATYIILLTVKGRKQDLIEGLQAGADDYVTKPFDTEELIARVRVGQRLIDLQQQRIEQETAYYVEQLEQAVVDLRESRARIVAAQEEVRQAIAEELHGHVQTQMCMLYFRLNDLQSKVASSPQEAQAELARIAEELDNLRESEIRKISHRLHPSVIRLSLSSGLRSLRDQFERSVPIDLEISKEVADIEPAGGSEIPVKIRLGMYRVVEEALGNVIKHAGASGVCVRLWLQKGDGTLGLSVEDNGRGFAQTDAPKKSLGLVTMQDYIGALGGSLAVISTPGQGTKITAIVPLSAE